MNNVHSNINKRNSRCEYNIIKNNEISSNNGIIKKIQPDGNTKTASLQIFAFIILQSWRRRRKEIKQLLQSVDDLKKSNLRSKTQLNVYTNLIRTEQNRNDELTAQLKRTVDSLKQATETYEAMSSNINSLKTNKALLEQELKLRYEEYDALHEIMSQTKTDLFRSMMDQRHLQCELCKEQRLTQSLKSQKNILINEICNLNTEHRKIEENLLKQLEDKDFDIKEARRKIEELQAALAYPKKNQIYKVGDKNEMQLLQLQVLTLQQNQNNSIGHRLGAFWSKIFNSQMSTLKYIHFMCYFLLPAMPPPMPTVFTS